MESVKHNKFDLSHESKISFEPGYLVPMLNISCLPGDKIRIKDEVFVRVAPMVAPIMHRVNVRTYYFFVPYRIIWDDAEEFFHRKKDNSSTVTVPRCIINNTDKAFFYKGCLSDYMGVPPTDGVTVSGSHYVSALPFRAYTEIYNEFFRPMEIIDEVAYSKSSADVTGSSPLGLITTLRKRSWDKDYFTAGKAQMIHRAQVNGYVPIQPTTDGVTNLYSDVSKIYMGSTESLYTTQANLRIETGTGILEEATSSNNLKLKNLNDPLGFDIDDLRRINSMQRWIEKLINVGSKYVDYLKAIWNVEGEDYRFQRPQYLGGSVQPIRISEVLNTSDTASAPQGNMSGHGMSAGESDSIYCDVREHGILLGLVCVMPKASYSQGLNVHLQKFDHLSFATPQLANLGRQALTNGEIYYSYTDGLNANNFAYQERYQEYKECQDQIAGEFRDTLAFWHYGRSFGARPSLNQSFVECTPKSTIFAVTTGHHYYAQIYHNIDALRKLPYYAVPSIE